MPRRSALASVFALAGVLAITLLPRLQRGLGDLVGTAMGLADRMIVALADVDPTILYIAAGVHTALEASLLVGLLQSGDLVVLFLGTTVTSRERSFWL